MRYFLYIIYGVMMSFYLFPVSFTFLPAALNSKMLLAFAGVFMFLMNVLRVKRMRFSYQLTGSMAMAALFSFLCLISCEINATSDYAYANYIVSFFTWLMGAYAMCDLLRYRHGTVTLQLITRYLTAVCVAQCILALVIDSSPAFEALVARVFNQDTAFFKDIDRIYGIGAALDPAGVRFSVVLILIVHNVLTNRLSRTELFVLWLCYVMIIVTGDIISRTTIVGGALSMAYLVARPVFGHTGKDVNTLRTVKVLGVILVMATLAVVTLYHSNEMFHTHMRFAFEGFFNWAEHGEWRTSSTDKLNNVMWVWPATQQAWIWGTGLFDNFVYATDIGYCRFVLYCGLAGFSCFVAFFVYNTFSVCTLGKTDVWLSALLFAVILIVWLKVATDIFFIYALLYCIDDGMAYEDTPPLASVEEADEACNSITA